MQSVFFLPWSSARKDQSLSKKRSTIRSDSTYATARELTNHCRKPNPNDHPTKCCEKYDPGDPITCLYCGKSFTF